MELLEQVLDERGRAWLRQCLAGGLSVAQAVLASVDLEAGHLYTLVPAGMAPEALYDFESGGKMPEAPPATWRRGPGAVAKPIGNAAPELAERVRGLLSGSPRRVCLVEDLFASPGAPWLQRVADWTFVSSAEVYHWAGPTAASERLLDVIKWCLSNSQQVGVVSELQAEPSFLPLQEIPPQELSRLLGEVLCIFAEAYDRESFVVWCKELPVARSASTTP